MIERPARRMPVGRNGIEAIDFGRKSEISSRFNDRMNGMKCDDGRRASYRCPRHDVNQFVVARRADHRPESIVFVRPRDDQVCRIDRSARWYLEVRCHYLHGSPLRDYAWLAGNFRMSLST